MTLTYPRQVRIVEVGPRDGLQNEAQPIDSETKLAFIALLAESGLRDIEVTSFVHPQRVPQLADAMTVAQGLPNVPNVRFSALVPNMKGLDRALEAGIRRIAVFTAASDTFTQKNIGMTISESIQTFQPVVERALTAGMSVRGYVSTGFVCPYEGDIQPEAVVTVSKALLEMGVDEISIGDTIGAAAPNNVYETVGLLLRDIPVERLALHFHDTYGTALANVVAGLDMGIQTFDASAGGLGGCPYAPGASGNLATEDLLYLLDRMGIESGVELDKVAEASRLISRALGRVLPSKQLQRLSAADCQL